MLAGVPEALASVRGERSDLPALAFDGTEIPRLDPGRRLEPIEDLDTLIELCSRLIEKLGAGRGRSIAASMRSLASATAARRLREANARRWLRSLQKRLEPGFGNSTPF